LLIPRYLRQQTNTLPKSRFKALLIVTSLLKKANKISLIQQIPEGLKSSEVERGNGRFQPLIPYIPESIETVDPDRKVPTIKVELKNGVESRIQVYKGDGMKEHFLCSMLNVREALEGMGLFEKYEKARRRVSDAKEALQNEKDLHDVVLEQIENTVLESDKEQGATPRGGREEAARHREAIKKHKAVVAV
jgi:hypothetical protein